MSDDTARHVTASSNHKTNGGVYTLDDMGVLRKWSSSSGGLEFDTQIPGYDGGDGCGSDKKVIVLDDLTGPLLAVVEDRKDGEGVSFHSVTDGQAIPVNNNDDGDKMVLYSNELLSMAKVKSSKHDIARIMDITIVSPAVIKVVIGAIDKETLVLKLGGVVQYNLQTKSVDSAWKLSTLSTSNTPFIVTGVKLTKNVMVGLSINHDQIIALRLNSATNSAATELSASSIFHDTNVQIIDLEKESDHLMKVKGSNGIIAILSLPSLTLLGHGMGVCLHDSKPLIIDAVNNHQDDTFALQLKYNNNDHSILLPQNTNTAPSLNGDITSVFLSCQDDHVIKANYINALFTTTGGTSIMTRISYPAFAKSLTVQWIAEESLAAVSSTTFLDIDTANTDTSQDEHIDVFPSFVERLAMQAQATKEFAASASSLFGLLDHSSSSSSESSETVAARDLNFGFAKIAVLLSKPTLDTSSRLFGLDTRNQLRTKWTSMLPPNANSHAVLRTVGGGGHYSHDLMVVSETHNNNVQWRCINGVNGHVLSKGTVSHTSTVAQVMSFKSVIATGGCHEHALLLYKDGTLNYLPQDHSTKRTLHHLIQSKAGGLYMHSIDKVSGIIQSFQIQSSNSYTTDFTADLVGEMTFHPDREKIVNVVYPNRDEVVQSPAAILGDDSLLLKYLNPHIAVVVTKATKSYLETLEQQQSNGNQYVNVLSGGGTSSANNKKKPLGATPSSLTKDSLDASATPLPSTTTAAIPSLFINIIDTVSAKILYRISHSTFTSTSSTALQLNPVIPLTITENWIIYSCYNTKTKRTELSTLTLHEGMIDKHGITMFHSPQQETTFTSFTTKKPIVLHKTFNFAKEITSLGVTNTKGGISSKWILLGLGSGSLAALDRRMLDPRRPSGEPKQAEKMEGLIKYAPIIPLVPQLTPSYHLYLENIHHISSIATMLESQSYVLSYGGPDIFLTILQPSKGFDLLPDSFNRILLSLGVLGLIVLFMVIKRMGSDKSVKITWS